MKNCALHLFMVILLCTGVYFFCDGGTQKIVTQTCKKVSDGLFNIRKAFPETQQQVYGLLDNVAKIEKLSQQLGERKEHFKKKLTDSYKSHAVEKTKYNTLQEHIEMLESKLQETEDKLDEEKSLSTSLINEHEKLKLENSRLEAIIKTKQQQLEAQSLSVTSTSEPISPR